MQFLSLVIFSLMISVLGVYSLSESKQRSDRPIKESGALESVSLSEGEVLVMTLYGAPAISRIHPKTGNLSVVVQLPYGVGYRAQAPLDSANALTYFLGWDSALNGTFLVAVDLLSGNVQRKVPLQIDSNNFGYYFPTLSFNPKSGDCLVIQYVPADGLYHLIRITPDDEVIDVGALPNQWNDIVEVNPTLDYKNGILWRAFQYPEGEMQRLAFDINTADVLYQISDPYQIVAMDYEPTSGLIYAFTSSFPSHPGTSYQYLILDTSSSDPSFQSIYSYGDVFSAPPYSGSAVASASKDRFFMTWQEHYRFSVLTFDLTTGALISQIEDQHGNAYLAIQVYEPEMK